MLKTVSGFSSLKISGLLTLNAVSSNGTVGTAGQVLTSNGTTTYWTSPAAASVNVAAQYTWTNTQTFTNTITFNSTINATSNNSTYFGGYTWAAPSLLGGTTANGASLTYANVSGQVNTATLYATTSANIASAVQANATGVWTTGTVNAASHTVGTSFTANSTVVNAVAYYAGTLLVANTTVSNATHLGGYTWAVPAILGSTTANGGSFTYANVSGQVNTVTLHATTSVNVNSNVQLSTSRLLIGNSTVNSVVNSSFLVTSGVYLYAQSGVSANTSEGTVFYDSLNHTLNVYGDDPSTPLEIGQQQYIRAVNKSGAAIPFATPVYLSGVQGNRPTIAPASANSSAYDVVGLVISSAGIANNAEGFVITNGLVEGVNTSGYTAGALLWLANTAGTLTLTQPAYPDYQTIVGQALNSTNNGKILVNINAQYLTPAPNSSVILWDGKNQISSGNLTFDYVNSALKLGNSSVNASINSTAYTGSANNAAYLGGTIASGYQTTAGLSANVATLTANNTSFVGSVSAANVVSNTQLSSNLANYAALAGATFTGPVAVNANVTITGNLVVTGTTFTANVTNLDVKDINITVAKGAATAAATDTAGITVDTANIGWYYNYASNTWQSNVGITPSANLSFNLGTSTLQWSNVYANNIVGTNVYGTLQTTSQPNITANNSTYFAGYTWAAPALLGSTTANGASLTYANVSGQVNTATLYATTSANIASAVQANATGVWTTGTVNAASHSVGTSFVANTTQVTISGIPVSSNGSTGTSGQVLTSNGTTGSPYWSTVGSASQVRQTYTANGSQTVFTVTGGYTTNLLDVYVNGVKLLNGTDVTVSSGSTFTITPAPANNATVEVVGYVNTNIIAVNVAAQYAWTNTHSFSNTVTLAAVSANGSLGTAAQALFSNGTATYWANVVGGAGYYKGGSVAAGTASNANNIFRINAQIMSFDTTINADENATCTGPLTVASGKTLSVAAGGRIAIV